MTMYAWRGKVWRSLSRMLLLEKDKWKEEHGTLEEDWMGIEWLLGGFWSRRERLRKHLKGASPQNTVFCFSRKEFFLFGGQINSHKKKVGGRKEGKEEITHHYKSWRRGRRRKYVGRGRKWVKWNRRKCLTRTEEGKRVKGRAKSSPDCSTTDIKVMRLGVMSHPIKERDVVSRSFLLLRYFTSYTSWCEENSRRAAER